MSESLSELVQEMRFREARADDATTDALVADRVSRAATKRATEAEKAAADAKLTAERAGWTWTA